MDFAGSKQAKLAHDPKKSNDGLGTPPSRLVERRHVASVAPIYVRPILAAAQRDGHDGDRMCGGLGFRSEDLENPGFMLSHAEANIVISRCIDALKRPCLGLELGRRSNIINRGVVALGLMASPTLGHAVKLKLRFPASSGLLLQVSAELKNADYIEAAGPLYGNHQNVPFLTEKMFASMVTIRRLLTVQEYAPELVEFMHGCSADDFRKHEEFFGCPVRFNAMQNRLVSGARWLDMPLRTASAVSYQFACQFMKKESEQADANSPVTLAVERIIRKGLPHPPHAALVANALNMSERTLRRKLAESGMTYHSMVDEAKKSRAVELVLSSKMNLQDLTSEAGFSDVRSFRRAFERWTGRSVSAARRSANAFESDSD